jgi:hypothetical protein
MGAASTDRLIAKRRRGQRIANQHVAEMKANMLEDRARIWRQAHEAIERERQKRLDTDQRAEGLQAKLDVMYANGPSVLEIVQVKARGFFGRLWWALGFARTGLLRYERTAKR